MCKEEQRSELMANGTRGQATFIFCFFLDIRTCLHADRIIQEQECWYKRVGNIACAMFFSKLHWLGSSGENNTNISV